MTKPLSPDQELSLQALLRREDIRARVEHFAGGSLSEGVRARRSQSYDHCYNYFADTKDLEADLEKSCAVLGIYLASWGMFRGSTYLLKSTNSSDLAPVVRSIQQRRKALNSIDVDDYSENNVRAIREAYAEIKIALNLDKHRPITLVTKIMAAVYGCVPAFDQNFTTGLRSVLGDRAKLSAERFTTRSLQLLKAFYLANQTIFDQLHRESKTVAFDDGAVTGHHLTKAKIVDMYCFDLGAYPTWDGKQPGTTS